MAIVVDSSAAATWCLPDEYSDLALNALLIVDREGMLVPALFWYELRNVLIVSERRGRLGSERSDQTLQWVLELRQTIDGDYSPADLMRLARSYNLTIYDAAYVELAKRADARLATLDRRLAAAATAEGIELISEVS